MDKEWFDELISSIKDFFCNNKKRFHKKKYYNLIKQFLCKNFNNYYIWNTNNFKALLILRNNYKVNIFRELYIILISSFIWDELFLTSWFIESSMLKYRKKKYLNNLYDALRNNVNKWLFLKMLWIYNKYKYKNEYTKFVKKIKSIPNLLICPKIIDKFHAKTLFWMSNNKLLFWLIWSSNLTKPAFWLSTPFNFEADILIYDSGAPWISEIVSSYIWKSWVLTIDPTLDSNNNRDLFNWIDNSRIMWLWEYALEILKELNDVFNKAKPL